MDPQIATHRYPELRFPRTRGDGPLTVQAAAAPDTFPPHSRGWTRASKVPGSEDIVSPALAGMDPRLLRHALRPRRFPRTRGDGPQADRSLPAILLFPPHSRGWTGA